MATHDTTELDLSQEKAKEPKERRRKLKLENDAKERILIPAHEVIDAIHKTGKIVIPILDNLTTDIKRRLLGTTAKQISFIEKDITKCKNAIAETRIK